MKYLFNELKSRISAYLLLKEANDPAVEANRWKLSALRIILVFGIFLEGAITVHTIWVAAQAEMYNIVLIVLVFFLLLSVALYLTGKSLKWGSWALITVVYAAGISIFTIIDIPEIARLGIVFFYTAPLIALILLGSRASLVFMLFNLVPFSLYVGDKPVPTFFHIGTTLPGTPIYIQSLVFLFFNICIPLAFSRVLTSLNYSTSRALQMNKTLEISLVIHEDVFQHNGAATLLCKPNGIILRCNDLAGALFERLPSKMETINLYTMLERMPEHIVDGWSSHSPTEKIKGFWKLRGDKKVFFVKSTLMRKTGNLLVSIDDWTEVHKLRSELNSKQNHAIFLAKHDMLTDLPNRAYFTEKLDEHLVQARQINSHLTVLNIKIRSLSSVNECCGINGGDNLIKLVGSSIKRNLLGADFLGRTRGGAFSLVLTGVQQYSEASREKIANYINHLPRRYSVAGQVLDVNYFIGAAAFPQDAETAQDLIHFSEVAQEAARKDHQSSPVYFDQAQAEAARRRINLEIGLRKALREHSLTMHYQPKVNVEGKLCGVEALVRWQSVEFGAVSPAEFIPVAERAGCIHDITLQVIEMVVSDVESWRRRGLGMIPVAINLSAVDLSFKSLIDEIILRTDRLSGFSDFIEFEITETALMVNGNVGLDNINALQGIGFKISIDDFGSGYSSLSKIAHMPVYAIKIDREFVKDVPGNVRQEKIIQGILSLAHSLNLSVVAEGVETIEQVKFLHARGCQLFQGYYFYRPMSRTDLENIFHVKNVAHHDPIFSACHAESFAK